MTKLYKFFLVLALIGSSTGAVNAQTSGTCGENLIWTLDNGTLTISGNGDMDNYTSVAPPWDSQKTNIVTLIVQDGVTSIGQAAFLCCSGLTSVSIGNSVISIGVSAFDQCLNLTSIIIPNSVISIGDTAFLGCFNLTEIYVSWINPPSIIQTYAFVGISQNAKLHIPHGTLSTYQAAPVWQDFMLIDDVIVGANASGFCGLYGDNLIWTLTGSGDNLTLTISGTGEMLDYLYLFGAPWNSQYTWNFQVKDIKTLEIQNGVTTIGSYAFFGCSGLTSISIPNSVIKIGDNAFSDCFSLTSVTIPNSVTTIGSAAFYYCSGLTSVTLPNSVMTIEHDAFSYCSGLTSVTIPNSVTTIGSFAFLGCSGLTDIYVSWINPPSVPSEAFWMSMYISLNAKLHIPQGTLSTYQAAPVWQDFILVDDVVTGMEQITPVSIGLYPNPVQDVLKIESGEMKMDKVEICDLSGHIVGTNYISQSGTTTISVSALPAGVYFVRIHTEKGILTKKIIKI